MQTRVGHEQTVLGLVSADALGVTHVHEHIWHDMSDVYYEPPRDFPERVEETVGFHNRWWVEQRPFNIRDNPWFGDVEVMTREIARFAEAGGGTLVELSNRGWDASPR